MLIQRLWLWSLKSLNSVQVERTWLHVSDWMKSLMLYWHNILVQSQKLYGWQNGTGQHYVTLPGSTASYGECTQTRTFENYAHSLTWQTDHCTLQLTWKLFQALHHFSVQQVTESWAGPGNEANSVPVRVKNQETWFLVVTHNITWYMHTHLSATNDGLLFELWSWGGSPCHHCLGYIIMT